MITEFSIYPLSGALTRNGEVVKTKYSIPDDLPQNIQLIHWKCKNVGSFYRLTDASENVPLEETEENYNLWVKPFAEIWEKQQEPIIQKRLTEYVQNILDAEAQKLGYDSCLSVCSYVDTGVTKFDDEGKAFRAWRSAVWAKGYEILDEVKAGEREIPTEEELIAELPALAIVYSE